MHEMYRQLMTPLDTAKYFGVATQTLSRWRVEGGGPPFIRVGGRIRYDLAELNGFLAAGGRRSTCDRSEGASK